MSTKTHHRAHGGGGSKRRRRRFPWTAVLGVLLVAAGALVVLDYQASRACQNTAFQELQRNLTARSRIADTERDAERTLVRTMLETDPDAEVVRDEAREVWLRITDRANRQRALAAYPEVVSC